MEITLNGAPQGVRQGSTIEDVLKKLGVDASDTKGIAVAVNDHVARRGTWADHELSNGDRVEVITALQGG